ncbi:MAG: EVE domain-containing protein [Planctomycetaceae bacterium]
MARYWLFKSEPEVFSIQDLRDAPKKTTSWEGIRNYQARNFLRDTVRKGDGVLFYHSNADPMGIAGIAQVTREAYPDHFAFDSSHRYFDPDSSADNPTWVMVDIQLKSIFPSILTRQMLAADPVCSNMLVLKRGSRLSIQPVTPAEWLAVQQLAEKLTAG